MGLSIQRPFPGLKGMMGSPGDEGMTGEKGDKGKRPTSPQGQKGDIGQVWDFLVGNNLCWLEKAGKRNKLWRGTSFEDEGKANLQVGRQEPITSKNLWPFQKGDVGSKGIKGLVGLWGFRGQDGPKGEKGKVYAAVHFVLSF